eukprot:2785332-Ditylum_brightwellii.AAC.1
MFGGNAKLHTTDHCNNKKLLPDLFDGHKKKQLDRAKKEEFCAMMKAFMKASSKGKKLIRGHITTLLNQTCLWKKNELHLI